MDIGKRIKELREKRAITQTDFAKAIGVSKQTLYKYENGIVTNIPSDRIEIIAKALKLDVELKRRNPFDGVGDLVPYDFRHTYCTDLQDAGVPINVARKLMGHSDISLTSRIYTHHSDESIEDARNRLNAACHPRATNPETVAK